MTARLYITQQGDMVDAICRAQYGTEVGTTEIVLDRNPGLAAQGPLLEEGVRIVLPDLAPLRRPVTAVRQLWD